jgi:hypothetical protein
MRIPVFSTGSNPAVDPPIIRKSLTYCADAVRERLADWVNAADSSKGIVAREFLPRENQPAFLPEPARPGLPPIEIDGIKFDDPEKDRAKLAERGWLLQQARTVAYFGADKDLTRLATEEA